jgi:hypothetical protein
VAFPTDLLHSRMHLFCHKGKQHSTAVQFLSVLNESTAVILNLILYIPTRYVMKFTRAEDQELTSIDSYATYVHPRARPIVALELLALRLRIRNVSGSCLGP